MASDTGVKGHRYENVIINAPPENSAPTTVHSYENVIIPSQENPDSKPKPPVKPKPEMLTHLYSESARRINVPLLEDYVRNAKENGYLEMQFKEIPKCMNFPCEEAMSHKILNRYKNILPYDKNRVVLETIPDQPPGSDYYNASFMNSYTEENAFIAASGPLPNSVNNFWRMIWETETDIVVMLTKIVELGNMKCIQYWPEVGEKSTYGQIKISTSQEDTKGDYTERSLTVTRGSRTRTIKHFQYTTWPDHGAPLNVSALLRLRNYIKSHRKKGHPALIHCSAGVGRTGTFLAIDYLLDQAEKEAIINVYDCVLTLRQQRVESVQTLEQYEFVYQACLDALVVGSTIYSVSEFPQVLSELKQDNGGTRAIETQYRMLDMVCVGHKKNDVFEVDEEDRMKNRPSCPPPVRRRRVCLMTTTEGQSDYINAVFVDGYKRKNAFLATQAPLAGTVIDIWKAVWDYNCHTIIMLCHFSKLKADELYFPTDRFVCHTAPFQVDHVASDDVILGNVITRTFTLSLHGHKRKIHHLSSTVDLETVDVNQKFKVLSQIYEMISASKDNSAERTPVLVHCLDGITTTGLVCCLFPVFDQINSEREIDVIQYIRQARTSRPQFIVSEEQYEALLDMTSLYINKKRSESRGVYCDVQLSVNV